MFGKIKIKVIKAGIQHFGECGFTRLPGAGDQNDFFAEIFPDIVFKIAFHGDHIAIDSEIVEYFKGSMLRRKSNIKPWWSPEFGFKSQSAVSEDAA